MLPDDILLNKASIIERCIIRIQEEYTACPTLDNFTHVDALVLNIERACQAAIDMAMHLVAENRYGIPQSSAHAFILLSDNNIIPKKLAESLQNMVGFRNLVVHNYQELDQAILAFVIEKGYIDFIVFCNTLGIKIAEK
ncbi:DUF86 domain-containing protein [Desulfobacula sp.]|uniref:type VII toxin-antitoxin system HepT family RNase toxin n=1 Tax=Desulfobacula sp. TaxID=2593537 RepID=UPI0025C536F2|nr:DUF86 domain-containing protein [Desulfobacula sp.]